MSTVTVLAKQNKLLRLSAMKQKNKQHVVEDEYKWIKVFKGHLYFHWKAYCLLESLLHLLKTLFTTYNYLLFI